MSTKLSCNVKNVILGGQNLSDIVGYYSRIRNCFSQLAVQKSINFNKPDSNYHSQDFVDRRLSNHVKNVLPQGLDPISLKWVSSEFPLHVKLLDQAQIKPICTPKLPWQSSFRFYYERKNPRCPPPGPKTRSDCKPEPPKRCPSRKPTCPPKKKTKCKPCGPKPKKSPCAKKSPCSRSVCTVKSLSLNQCRLYCKGCGGAKKKSCFPQKKKGGACGAKKKSGACGPRKKPGACGAKKKPGACGQKKSGACSKKPKCG